jgi:hypothetical protein
MKLRNTSGLPAELSSGQRVFERWRRSRDRSWRIPERLWSKAVELAAVYGVCRTSRVLGLDYNALKKRVGGSRSEASPSSTSASGFVELLAPAAGVESVIEVEARDGTKLRVHVKGGPAADVVALVRSFRDAGR